MVDGLYRFPDDRIPWRACDVNCTPNGAFLVEQSCGFNVRSTFFLAGYTPHC